MSLKAFHLVFMTTCLIFAGGFGAWGLMEYRRAGEVENLIMGVGSIGLMPVLLVYMVWFLKKLKNVGYL